MVNLPASDQRLDEIRHEIRHDDILKLVMHYILLGWLAKHYLSGTIKNYWAERGSISVHNDLLLRGNRLVISTSLRKDIIRYLHDAYQGITKSCQNAASSVWWPGITGYITSTVKDCSICEKFRRERIEPVKGTEFPKRPWSRVDADFFMHKGRNYLIVIDYYSHDVEICLVTRNFNRAETICKLKKVFSRRGVCDILFTNNGPQFDSMEFKAFSKIWRFEHLTSLPRYAQSNGEAERAVQTANSFLNKCDVEYLALLTYRNTPLHNGYSPTQLSMGKKIKTRVPCNPEDLMPKLPQYALVRKKESVQGQNGTGLQP